MTVSSLHPHSLHITSTENDGNHSVRGQDVASKRRHDMKWGGYNRKGEERMNRVAKRVFGAKGLYFLVTLAGLALLLAENVKWCPGGR